MLRYLGRRVASGLVVLFGLTVLAFALVRLIPGDPVTTRLGLNSTPEQIASIRQQLGLNGSPASQYFSYLGHLLTGNFGRSVVNGGSVWGELRDRLPVSLELALFASMLAILWGVLAGVISAGRKERSADRVVRAGTFLAMSAPPFVVGTILVLLVSLYVPAWPITGFTPFVQSPLRNVQGLLLPAITLGLPLGAVLSRYTRASLIDVLGQDFLRTARAKGVGEWRLITVHALRSALVPVVTISGIQLASLVGGAIVVEQVFALPGVGSLIVQSINRSDYPMVQGSILIIGAIFVLLNLAVDMLYPVIDPRTRAHG